MVFVATATSALTSSAEGIEGFEEDEEDDIAATGGSQQCQGSGIAIGETSREHELSIEPRQDLDASGSRPVGPSSKGDVSEKGCINRSIIMVSVHVHSPV